MNEHQRLLKVMVKGAYDLQMIRMQIGLRLCANFRAKLQPQANQVEGEAEDEDARTKEIARAEKVIDLLKKSYKRLTEGVVAKRDLPTEKGFHGDELISEYAELVLVDQYIALERQEAKQFRYMTHLLEKIEIYNEYLEDVVGIGPAMAAVLITSFDIQKAHYISCFWSYAGLDVAPNGLGRSRRREHLVEREYTDRDGKIQTKMGLSYNPWLKTKLLGALGPSFLRSGSKWRGVYDDYKHRLETDNRRERVTLNEYKKRHLKGEDTSKLWPPGRIHRAAQRYMVKMFLQEFWLKWRAIEGLEITPSYYEAKLGGKPHQPHKRKPLPPRNILPEEPTEDAAE